MAILLLNYAHPLTSEQIDQITWLLGTPPEVRDIAVQADYARPIAEVAREMADAAGFAPAEWHTLPLIINLPGLASLALALIAEIHGRCGHFPAVLNIRPVAGAMPVRYEIGEIVDLQQLRDAARMRR